MPRLVQPNQVIGVPTTLTTPTFDYTIEILEALHIIYIRVRLEGKEIPEAIEISLSEITPVHMRHRPELDFTVKGEENVPDCHVEPFESRWKERRLAGVRIAVSGKETQAATCTDC